METFWKLLESMKTSSCQCLKSRRFNLWALEESLFFNLYTEGWTDSADGTREDLNELLGAEDKSRSWNLGKGESICYSWNEPPGSGLNSLFLVWRCWPQNRDFSAKKSETTPVLLFPCPSARPRQKLFDSDNWVRTLARGSQEPGGKTGHILCVCMWEGQKCMCALWDRVDQLGRWQMKPNNRYIL